jgi:twitching motility two-component system response regulator PilH
MVASLKILVADDSPVELKLMIEPFLANGFDVITATNGEEALLKAEEEEPALIVLDVVMPKLNGYEVCKKIKESSKLKDTPVILLTSKNNENDKIYGIKQGANAYMTKPFTSEELMATVNKLL